MKLKISCKEMGSATGKNKEICELERNIKKGKINYFCVSRQNIIYFQVV